MKNRVIPTFVGAFVVLAITLMILAVFFVLAYSPLEKAHTYVLYFQGPMRGLQVGSPVTYRGIKVGEVTKTQIEVDHATGELRVPVFIQFLRGKTNDNNIQRGRDFMERAFKRGMRAQLYTTNILTGQVGIQLVFKSDSKAVYETNDTGYPQIPTITERSQEIDIGDVLAQAEDTLKTIKKMVNQASPQVQALINNTNQTISQAGNMFDNINYQVQPTSKQINQTLQEFDGAAQALRQLADQLEQNPESIITGKK